MNNEEFRMYGHQLIDWLADFMSEIEDLPVVPDVQPGDIIKQLPPTPPEEGVPFSQIFDDFRHVILPGMTHWQHPGWFAYFPANNSPPSILGELLAAGLGAQCMVWQTSPAAEELEVLVMNWLRQMLALPDGMVGVIQDSASTASLCALLSAREKATMFNSNVSGIQQPLTIYASKEAHSSIVKGAKIAGYGEQNIRLINTDSEFAMIPAELERAIQEDKNNEYIPACVVAMLGTTSSTGVDPLEKIGRICHQNGIWLHVDAAYAGSAALLPEKRWILQGAEYMDSFVFNPHKWLLTNFDCSAYYVKDKDHLIKTFEIHPEYLKTSSDHHVNNFRDWGIQLGRRFRALKLWFVIRTYGISGLQVMLRKHIELASQFKSWVEDHEYLELMAPVHFSLVCFRVNNGQVEDILNEMNKELLFRINQEGKVFLTQTTLNGKYVLRMAIGQRTTGEDHIQLAWKIITEKTKEIIEKFKKPYR